jgi:heterodisulfide reductase subunit B
MKVGYYPGCTLKGKAKSLDDTTQLSVKLLGCELVELPDWTCCGATTPLTGTKIANLIAQTRLLGKTRDAGYEALVTTCPFCFSTLRRANLSLKNDELKRKRMNTYLAEDRRLREYETPPPPYVPYEGETRVLHLLEWLRDEVGFDYIAHAVSNPLRGLRVAPFYGCQLLRPAEELTMCDPENPTILEDFLGALVAEVLDFPSRIDCCGSYLSVAKPEAALKAAYRILASSHKISADVVAVTCPLCFYNLDSLQEKMTGKFPEFRPIPIMYFTQLMAYALGAPIESLGLESNKVDPRPLFERLSGSIPREVPA